MKNETEFTRVLATLNHPDTIRIRAQILLDYVKNNKSPYFSLNYEKMTSTASLVIEVIRDNYPTLDIPYHSRWRHFETGTVDRIKKMREKLTTTSAVDVGKILYELAIISVLLDAGAGPLWHYQDAHTQKNYTRSEGLALASLALYQHGVFSANPKEPLRVDAQRLLSFREEDLQLGFQITINNPLEGAKGRVALLNRLGLLLQQDTLHFGSEGRLGNFYTYVNSLTFNQELSAIDLFQAVLSAFNAIWPVRLSFQGVSLGDVWQHKALKTEELGSELIPFHKLSQWLTYSLIEPLEQAGIKITHLGHLTGLPEYRNGGLFIDTEVLGVKNKELREQPHAPDTEIVVEWRALTVVLLDELAELIRKKLNKTNKELPLAKILQGGTWDAGRRIAQQKRPEGTPPLQIISDGTVF